MKGKIAKKKLKWFKVNVCEWARRIRLRIVFNQFQFCDTWTFDSSGTQLDEDILLTGIIILLKIKSQTILNWNIIELYCISVSFIVKGWRRMYIEHLTKWQSRQWELWMAFYNQMNLKIANSNTKCTLWELFLYLFWFILDTNPWVYIFKL